MDAAAAEAAAQTKCVHVLSDVDGYKYKLVMQGDVQLLSVRKIKRYLQRAAGVDPAHQLLTFNGAVLADGMSGKDAGLFDGAILRLQQQQQPMMKADTNTSPRGRGSRRESGALSSSRLSEMRATDAASASSPFISVHPEDLARRTFTPRLDGSFVEVTPTSPPTPLTGIALGTPQLVSTSPSGSAPRQQRQQSQPLRRLSLNQLASGSAAGTPVDMSTCGQLGAAPASASPVTTAAAAAAAHDLASYCAELEARVAALSLDNVRLREQLQVVARQAAEAAPDWRLEEEVRRLQTAVAAAQQQVAEAQAAAGQRWRVKEEELVKELDLLREERRRLQDDATAQEAKMQDLVHSMEGEIRGLQYELHDKEAALQSAQLAVAESRSRAAVDSERHATAPMRGFPIDDLAEAALGRLTEVLDSAAPLQLDPDNDTCVVPVSADLNLLVTLDRESERLFLYVTLLDSLPASPVRRMQLYETLLQGALLGKDMAGGGVGVSLESNLVLMSISADLRHIDAAALAVAAMPFVSAAHAWMESIGTLLAC